MASDPRAKLLRLLDARQELSEKMAAIDAEMRALVTGDEGIGDKLARLKAQWCAVWSEVHSEKCDFDHKKDTGFLKTKLLAGFTEDEIVCKFQSYLTNTDAYYVRARHPFGLFRTNFNSWRGVPARATAVVGCGHEPTCVDGAACTARKYLELSQ